MPRISLVFVAFLVSVACCARFATAGEALPNAPFVAHSKDYPRHPLWPGLDATVTETQRNDRLSLLSVVVRKGSWGAGAPARFVWCAMFWMAGEKGYTNFKFAIPMDYSDPPQTRNKDQETELAVVFLKSPNEDLGPLLGNQQRRYKQFREIPPSHEFLRSACDKNL